jgi:hypothetical protein
MPFRRGVVSMPRGLSDPNVIGLNRTADHRCSRGRRDSVAFNLETNRPEVVNNTFAGRRSGGGGPLEQPAVGEKPDHADAQQGHRAGFGHSHDGFRRNDQIVPRRNNGSEECCTTDVDRPGSRNEGRCSCALESESDVTSDGQGIETGEVHIDGIAAADHRGTTSRGGSYDNIDNTAAGRRSFRGRLQRWACCL